MKEDSILPIWCEKCNQEGFILIPDIKRSYFVVCERCGWETSQVFCPNCQAGGEFVRGIEERPTSWTCTSCSTQYELPMGFYQQPIPLSLETNKQWYGRFKYENNLRTEFLDGMRGKWQILLVGLLLGGPFVISIPVLVGATTSAPLWPSTLLLLLFAGWSLFIGVGHRAISWVEFKALAQSRQQRRLYYESAWYHLYLGGYAFFGGASFFWSAILAWYFRHPRESLERLIWMILCVYVAVFLLYFGVQACLIARAQISQMRSVNVPTGFDTTI
jgi:hypothetical protein